MSKGEVESVCHLRRQTLKRALVCGFVVFVINIPRSLFSKTAVITSILINGAFNQVCNTVVHSLTLTKHTHTQKRCVSLACFSPSPLTVEGV